MKQSVVKKSSAQKKFKVIDVVGARPQFVKLSAVARAFKNSPFDYVLINTDQHYDDRMRDVFFSELQIKTPDYSLGVGSGSHATRRATWLSATGGGIRQRLHRLLFARAALCDAQL